MVREKIYYVCEKCNSEYSSRMRAENCEKGCGAIVPKFKVGQKVKENLMGKTGTVVKNTKIIHLLDAIPDERRTVGYLVEFKNGIELPFIEENLTAI